MKEFAELVLERVRAELKSLLVTFADVASWEVVPGLGMVGTGVVTGSIEGNAVLCH